MSTDFNRQEFEARIKNAQKADEFKGCGEKAGLEIWRVEKFNLVKWPEDKYGKFYDGDSYVVLQTVIPPRGSKQLHAYYWLGAESTQDEKGVAAYKTVELDDYFKGAVIQHREVQGHESKDFLDLFGTVQIMKGGIESGFKKSTDYTHPSELFHIKGVTCVVVNQVEPTYKSLNSGDAFVLTDGKKVWVWFGKSIRIQERIRALNVGDAIVSQYAIKHKKIEIKEGEETEEFWTALGGKGPIKSAQEGGDDYEFQRKQKPPVLFRLSDASGKMEFTKVAEGKLNKKMLDTNDVFICDTGNHIFVWIGKKTTINEKKYSMFYAEDYLKTNNKPSWIPITKILEGLETTFFQMLFNQ